MNPDDRRYLIIGIIIALCACVAAWLTVPQVQTIFNGLLGGPRVTGSPTFAGDPETVTPILPTSIGVTGTTLPAFNTPASTRPIAQPTTTPSLPTNSPQLPTSVPPQPTSQSLPTVAPATPTNPPPPTNTQIPPSNTPVPPTNTATNTPVPTTTALLFEWSIWHVCDTDPDVIENRVHNLNQVDVQVTGFIKAQPAGGEERIISEVPLPYQNCPAGAWCGPGERIRNQYPQGFQGAVWGTTSVYYQGVLVGSNAFGPVQLTCSG